MGIIAWIVLGLAANMLIPGKRSQGLILTCLIGDNLRVLRRDRLGGLLHEYSQAA